MKEVFEHNTQQQLVGTCQWIWSIDKVVKWRSTTSTDPANARLLLITGIPGCGKSILASAMVQNLRNESQAVVYFSFSAMDPARRTQEQLVRFFLWQKLHETLSRERLEVARKLLMQNQPTASELWNAFIEVTSPSTREEFWIIDGLDESETSNSEFIKLIIDKLQFIKTCRAVILGRPASFPLDDSSTMVQIEPKMTAADLNRYIEDGVQKSENLRRQAMQSLALEKLRDSSQGMFLWVKFMINDLNKPASTTVIKTRLLNLPHGLKETYRHILSALLENMDEIDRKATKILLALIVVARQSFNITELHYAQALAAWIDSKSSKPFAYSEYAVADFSMQLSCLCRNLIYISDEKVHLAHASAKEFLTRHESEWAESKDRAISILRVDVSESENLISRVCIRYLGLESYAMPFTSEGPVTATSEYPLLNYASRNLVSHIRQSKPQLNALTEDLLQFAGSKECLAWVENYAACLLLEAIYTDIEDFEALIRDMAMNPVESQILDRLRNTVEIGIAEITTTHGQHCWKTDHLQFILSHLGTTVDDDEEVLEIEGTLDSQLRVQEMTKLVVQQSSLSVPTQLNLVFGLSRHLSKIKRLTDPIEVLFRSIMNKAVSIPFPILMLIGNFYEQVNKEEKAIEVWSFALSKTERDSHWGFWALYRIGQVRLYQGKWVEAEDIYNEMLDLSKIKDDTLLTVVKEKLITALTQQKKFTEAEPLCQEVLDNYMKTLGPEDTTTLRASRNLAAVYHYNGRYYEAEKMYQHTLRGYRKSLDSTDIKTVDITNSFGVLYLTMAMGDQVEKQSRQGLENHTKTSRSSHIDMNGMIDTPIHQYTQATLFAEAEKMFQEALQSYMTLLGPYHRKTLGTTFNLGMHYVQTKPYDEAESMLQRALEGHLKTLGPSDPYTIDLIATLGELYRKAGRPLLAADKLEQAFQGCKKASGSNHEITLNTCKRLGMVYLDDGRYEKAETMFQQALRGFEELGTDADSLFLIINDLGVIYEETERRSEAEKMFCRAMQGYINRFGPDHRKTLVVVRNLERIKKLRG